MLTLLVLFLFLLAFLVFSKKYLKKSILISYVNTLSLNKAKLRYLIIYIFIFLFHLLYIIYTGSFEYCSNDADIVSSNNNSGPQQNTTTHIEANSTGDSEQNTTSRNQGNNTGNSEQNPTSVNGQDIELTNGSNIGTANSDQIRGQEILDELDTLREFRLELIDRHDEIRSAMRSLQASHNTNIHNNPEYVALDQEDMVNREIIDAITEKEDNLDLELKAIDPSHETINERQTGQRNR